MAYDKKKMKCPYCSRELSINGMTQHVRFNHPNEVEDFKKNRKAYIDKNTLSNDAPEPEVPTPVEAETVESKVEVEDAPAESFPEPEEEEEEFFRIRKIDPEPEKPKSKPRRKRGKKEQPAKEGRRGLRIFRH